MVIGIRLPGIKFKPSHFPGVGPWAIYLPLCISVFPFMRIRVCLFSMVVEKGLNELVNIKSIEEGLPHRMCFINELI